MTGCWIFTEYTCSHNPYMNDTILENFLAAWNRFAWYLDTQDFCQNSPTSETQNNLRTTSESSKKSFPVICGPLSSILHEHVFLLVLSIVATMRTIFGDTFFPSETFHVFFCLVVGLLWFAFWMIGNWFIAFWVVYAKVKFECISHVQVCVTNLFS